MKQIQDRSGIYAGRREITLQAPNSTVNSIVSQYPNEVGVDFIILKHRWRRKQITEEEVVEAEKEVPQVDAENSPKLGIEVLPFIAF